ncbi:MAG: hypothetical protein R2706_01910 [Acidimicrobiales bacterium]
MATLDSQVLDAEAELAALGGSDVGDVLSTAQRLAERIKGQKNVVGERQRRLERELQSTIDQGVVASLEAEAAQITTDLAAAVAESARFAPAFGELDASESAFNAEATRLEAEADVDSLGPAPAKAAEVRAQLQVSSRSSAQQQDAKRLADQIDVLAARPPAWQPFPRETVRRRCDAATPASRVGGAALAAATADRERAERAVRGWRGSSRRW